MTEIREELERREKLARSAIKEVYGTEEDEYGNVESVTMES